MSSAPFQETVTGHTRTEQGLILHTLDPDRETDLVSTGEGLKSFSDALTEEQREHLRLAAQ